VNEGTWGHSSLSPSLHNFYQLILGSRYLVGPLTACLPPLEVKVECTDVGTVDTSAPPSLQHPVWILVPSSRGGKKGNSEGRETSGGCAIRLTTITSRKRERGFLAVMCVVRVFQRLAQTQTLINSSVFRRKDPWMMFKIDCQREIAGMNAGGQIVAVRGIIINAIQQCAAAKRRIPQPWVSLSLFGDFAQHCRR
jgi:hypothetical protein